MDKMISSEKNERVKAWKKLHQRKFRHKEERFLIEGYHLLEEAWKSGWPIKEIILLHGATLPDAYQTYPVTEVNETVFKQITQTESPQGIIAVMQMKESKTITGPRILMIDAVQDPGNLGNMIRTADAAGYNAIVLGDGTVDVYNDKVIRATQGSIFHIPFLAANLSNLIKDLRTNDFQIITSALKKSVSYSSIQVPDKTALIVGNEGAGVDDHLIALADRNVHIPIYGGAESLNVNVAAGILMYHFR